MYNTNNTVKRIKQILCDKHISTSKMLVDLEFGVNALYQFEQGRVMSSFNLAKIADYLDCSVDYLLGRTDVVEVNRGYYPSVEEIAAYGADGTRGTFTTPPKEIT